MSSGRSSAESVMQREHVGCAADRQRIILPRVNLSRGSYLQSVACGARTRRMWTRDQSSPSRSAESCAGDRRITPSWIAGQRNLAPSSRLMRRHTPVPSQNSSFTLSAALGSEDVDDARERIGLHLLLHVGRKAIHALAEVDRLRRDQHANAGRRHDHASTFRAFRTAARSAGVDGATNAHRRDADANLDCDRPLRRQGRRPGATTGATSSATGANVGGSTEARHSLGLRPEPPHPPKQLRGSDVVTPGHFRDHDALAPKLRRQSRS